MAVKRSDTIAEYIQNAPTEGQPHLHRLYAILKSVAPEAAETIKWGIPFFVEPPFLFAFSAHKSRLNFTPNTDALETFREDLASSRTTQGSLQVRYKELLPEELIRKIAEHRVQVLSERGDEAFW